MKLSVESKALVRQHHFFVLFLEAGSDRPAQRWTDVKVVGVTASRTSRRTTLPIEPGASEAGTPTSATTQLAHEHDNHRRDAGRSQRDEAKSFQPTNQRRPVDVRRARNYRHGADEKVQDVALILSR